MIPRRDRSEKHKQRKRFATALMSSTSWGLHGPSCPAQVVVLPHTAQNAVFAWTGLLHSLRYAISDIAGESALWAKTRASEIWIILPIW
jgi:hypothetical protein